MNLLQHCQHIVAPCVDVRNPFSVTVFEDHVYWSTQEKGEVFRQDKFGRGEKVKLLTAGPWLSQVSVYQQQRYNSIASKLTSTFKHFQDVVGWCFSAQKNVCDVHH